MHILLVPSWYPDHPDDFNGSFFREQAQALIAADRRVGVLSVRSVPVYDRHTVRNRRRTIQAEDDVGIATVRADVVLPIPKAHRLNYAVHYKRTREAFSAYVEAHGKPDVLHAHTMFPAGILTHRLSREFDIPFIVTEHRPSTLIRLRDPWNHRHAAVAAHAADSRFAVAAPFAAELESAYGSDGDPWEYRPGLLSPQFENEPVRVPPPRPPFVFGHVSHLDDNKRADLLIDAFADRFAHDDDTELRIVGHGPETDRLTSLADARGVSERVRFVGAVTRARIASEFAHMHSFVLPSATEAFGTVLWEAMARGVPIVATATWAGRNAVSPSVGLMVDVDDRDALGGALERMRMTFDDYDPEMIRATSVAHCGREAFVDLYDEAYRRAVSKR